MKQDASLPRAQLDELADQIAVCAARIDSALHQLLGHIRQFEQLKGWAKQGSKSCAHWLSWRIGLGLVAAREKVRVAVALGGLPQIDGAFSRGELSYAKVRAITRVATRKNEDLLLAQARGTTGAELERICAGFRRLGPTVALDDERRFVRRRTLGDGLVQIEMRLLPDEAERVWQAIAEARRALAADDTAESSRAAGPTLVDAAVAMADASLVVGRPAAGTVAADRRMLFVHLSEHRVERAEEISQGEGRGDVPWNAELQDGTGISGATLLRLACDTSLLVARTDVDGRVLDLGRRSRTVSPTMLRALRLRDRRCRFPGCRSAAFVDAHHIEHWADGGETSIDNLVLVCHAHHVALHEGGFAVERGPDGGFVFRDPEQQRIEAAPRAPAVDGDASGWLREEQCGRGVVIEPATALVRRPFWGLEVAGCVRALAAREWRSP